MKTLAIDIETYSPVDLRKCGVYKYVEHPEFEILMIAFQYEGNTYIIDLRDPNHKPLLNWFLSLLLSEFLLFTAHNANFERTCLAKYFGIELPPEQWNCTMVKGAMIGLPFGLDDVGKALKLDTQKDKAGKDLIRYFSMPCKPTKKNGFRTRNLPEHDPEKWEAYKQYCMQDVRTEQAVRDALSFFTPPEKEVQLWNLDQRINDEGILVDPGLIGGAIQISNEHKTILTQEAVNITGLNNPNSTAQLRKWLESETEEQIPTLRKQDVPELLQKTSSETVSRVLRIRQDMNKTSVKKFSAMLSHVCTDSRIRGLFKFYGANRTGRWAGGGVQPQNLRKNSEDFKEIDLARGLVKARDREGLEMVFGSVPDTLSQLIRTAFVAKPGHRFIVSDFASIEAVVLSWLAGEQWRLDVFTGHGRIYEETASKMFGIPIEQITKKSPHRQKGKLSDLACGYQGGPGAIRRIEISTNTPIESRLKEEELQPTVDAWRAANPRIVRLWYAVQDAAKSVIKYPGSDAPIYPGGNTKAPGIYFRKTKGMLEIKLPSGRCLYYMRAAIHESAEGRQEITFQGIDQTTKQWGTRKTYGGSLVENIVQAIARDCLAESMLKLSAAGYKIVMHVHDEVVLEMPHGIGSVADVCQIMGEPLPWAPGLPLKAEAYECEYYKKD